MFYQFDPLYWLFALPAIVLSLWAQFRVKSAYKKMSKVYAASGYTGAQAAAAVLRRYNIGNVRVEQGHGRLSDHFDPRSNVIRLSPGVYGSATIAAIGIACHEAGHAAQYAENYSPAKLRNGIVKVCNIGSWMGIPLIFLGYSLGFGPLIYIGLSLYAMIAVFQLVTLPVEFNASRRALAVIDELGLLRDDREMAGAKKVLSAAALTYVAALASTLTTLIYYVLRFTSGGGRGSRRR